MLDQLTEELNALSSAGQQMVSNAMKNAEWSDVAELRMIMSGVMEMVCSEVSDMAAARSAEFYDSVRKQAVGKSLGAIVDSGRDSAATDGAVRALAQSVVDTGSTDRFVRELSDRVDYEIKKAAGDCVVANASRDPLKPRYARVPTGRETCPFCIMLASRGFVYRSNRSAGSVKHYHQHCNCRIVPGFDGMLVEGHDLDGYYRQYVDDLESGKLKLKTVSGSTSHVLHWKGESFGSYGDFAKFINAAEDVEDLQQRCAVAAQEWKETGLSDKYWSQLKQTVMSKRSEFDNLNGAGKVNNGALSGALNNSNDPTFSKRSTHAKSYYEATRKRDKETEVTAISSRVGVDAETVSRAYDHLFISKHDLVGGKKRFDPDYEIAESWQRLRAGKDIEPHDITLIRHEAYEDELMQGGMSYAEAHKQAEMRYNYSKELDAFTRKKSGGA